MRKRWRRFQVEVGERTCRRDLERASEGMLCVRENAPLPS